MVQEGILDDRNILKRGKERQKEKSRKKTEKEQLD